MVQRPSPRQLQKARLLALVLPEAERHELERRYGRAARPALLSAFVGFFELWLGVALYTLAHPGFGGGFGIVVWHLNPIAWLGLLTIVTALLRVANYFANHDSFGEPLVWVFLRLRGIWHSTRKQRRALDAFGPPRPDRVVHDGAGALVLLASREKEGWDEYSTVRIEDEFFRVRSIEERQDGRYRSTAYVLEEIAETEALRGIVHTDAALPRSGSPAKAVVDGSGDA